MSAPRPGLPAALLAALLLLASAPARAEAPVLTATSHPDTGPRVVVLAGLPAQGGVGLLLPDGGRGALGVELVGQLAGRVAEARAGWQLPLARAGLFDAALQLGGTAYLVPVGRLDAGLGAHAGLFGGFGGQPSAESPAGVTAHVSLGVQAGAEVFARELGPRVPLRAVLAGRVVSGPLWLGLTARGGLDLEPARAATYRGEALLLLGWTLAVR